MSDATTPTPTEKKTVELYTKAGTDKAISVAVGAVTVPNVDLSGLETTEHAAATYQPKGDYALKSDIPQVPDTSTFATTDALEQGLSAKADKSALGGLETTAHASATYQPKGSYATSEDLSSGLATKANAATLTGYTKTDATDALAARVTALESTQGRVVVLGASDPVPDGTAADTVIVRVQ